MNPFNALLGESPEFQAVIRSSQIAAATDVTLLLLGESGTGKEMLARGVHQSSGRAGRAFVAINCAALPESLAESELFGHRKGAFTGAVADNPGYIRSAHGGTLFLDEVGELPLSVQTKLLRFLESGECQSLGSSETRHSDVRLIAATHRDLRAQVEAGAFREDLYYRIHVVPLELPSLRHRTGDVTRLVSHFITEMAEKHGVDAPSFNRSAMARLAEYRWPGNVRELRNLCERMVILLSGQDIGVDNLPAEIAQPSPQGHIFDLPASGISLDQLEQQMISQALDRSEGNCSKAARLLGLTRDTLLYRIKKYAISA
ncbi:sigma-54-dependent Fis family transcriptional regulator [Solemya pervernicosa gill symbiont]|uniref:Sigma-54-dependent Fis family transcriptional regulator n=2 Tax=Gammaproteobacteria incertae sedis TaxID=118884 RepID=A0A1T2LB74_9GAMM|nr:sigma-54 dependent transcriptional regulator [Candidatus Reidiella endopervernicosa]OOZ42347.1 sigma-54-dependent Fis family transcriptional regulator [Solemya pervernicosa gill symbiont]QKQ25735.1 sigma-54-dependent Fis family transcriptional regulator [Candidatus Reidiella endopervernicosa]